MNLDFVLQRIIDFRTSYKGRNSSEMLRVLLEEKERLKKNSDSDMYNELILWLKVFKSQEYFLKSFKLGKEKDFYKSWCVIEKGLSCFDDIKAKNSNGGDVGAILFIRNYFLKLQKLFPYKVFGSPEFSCKRQCSICSSYITFRKRCEHKQGTIYNGVVCKYIITDFEFLAMAMVENPVQKYSVPFGIEEKTGKVVDHYNYAPLELLFAAIEDPFEEWDYEWTTTNKPRKNFNNVSRISQCPCGSRKKFGKCCFNKSVIVTQHIQFIFLKEAHLRLKKNPPVIVGKPNYKLSNKFNLAIFEASDEDLL